MALLPQPLGRVLQIALGLFLERLDFGGFAFGAAALGGFDQLVAVLAGVFLGLGFGVGNALGLLRGDAGLAFFLPAARLASRSSASSSRMATTVGSGLVGSCALARNFSSMAWRALSAASLRSLKLGMLIH